MPMTPDARRALSTTIRSLRARLLGDLHDATQTAYRLSVRARDAGLDEAARSRRARLEAWVAEQIRAQRAATRRISRKASCRRRSSGRTSRCRRLASGGDAQGLVERG